MAVFRFEKRLALLLTVFSSVSVADLQAVSDEGLSEIAGQSGLTVETVFNSEVDVFYEDSGNVVKIEGLQVVQTGASGEITSTPAAVITEFDIVSNASDSNAAVAIQSTFQADSAVKIDAIRLGQGLNGANTGNSLGAVNLSGVTGRSIVTIRGR